VRNPGIETSHQGEVFDPPLIALKGFDSGKIRYNYQRAADLAVLIVQDRGG
jgi:hypothetical protein